MGMLNIASLPKHIEEIGLILAEKCLDILALNETRLDNNITNQDMFIQNYDLIRADRSRTGGGVCLYIRNSINYFERIALTRDNLEAVCIEVNKPSSASFIVGTIYRPPGASVDSFANIEQLIKLIDDKNKEFYMLGDLNANMLDISNNATKNLNSIIELLYQLTQTISSPTRVTMTSSTLLDVCLTPTPDKLVLSKVVQIAIAVFLDLQKAFDTINHNILIKKLDLYGLQKPALNLLGSYLENRFQMCTVNGVGSILGPLLFLIYINDLPSSLEHSSS